MIGDRLPLALEAVTLPGDGPIVVFHPPADADLRALPKDRVAVVSPLGTVCDAFAAQGYAVQAEAKGLHCAAAVVCLTRAKTEAQMIISQAMALTHGPILIDGQKTDGVEAMLRAVRDRTEVTHRISKAHGKAFWVQGGADFTDWAHRPALHPGGFWTGPGVFSADGVDPASELLVQALPQAMAGNVADLGAGWGYLSAHVLTRDVGSVHLVENHNLALQCAQHNVTDPRAQFHWADITRWQPPVMMDAVVMNPPFHVTRRADPTLGQTFIRAAAAMLRPQGVLWMVANRHLPYEDTLDQHFAKAVDLSSDARFKLVRAERPKKRKG